MALSIASATLAFLPGSEDVQLGGISVRASVAAGILTLLIFFLAIIDLTVNWQHWAWEHDDAAHRLSELKGQFRAVSPESDPIDAGDVDLREMYELTMREIKEIPERQFLSMKAKHHRKVVVSKLIDKHPGAPLPYVRLLATLQGLRERKNQKKLEGREQEAVEEPPG